MLLAFFSFDSRVQPRPVEKGTLVMRSHCNLVANSLSPCFIFTPKLPNAKPLSFLSPLRSLGRHLLLTWLVAHFIRGLPFETFGTNLPHLSSIIRGPTYQPTLQRSTFVKYSRDSLFVYLETSTSLVEIAN